MEKNEIKAKLIELLGNLFPKSEVNGDILEYVDLIDDLGMDSITFISIVIEVETTFDIIVPDEMLLIENFRNIDAILSIVESQLSVLLTEEVRDVKA